MYTVLEHIHRNLYDFRLLAIPSLKHPQVAENDPKKTSFETLYLIFYCTCFCSKSIARYYLKGHNDLELS